MRGTNFLSAIEFATSKGVHRVRRGPTHPQSGTTPNTALGCIAWFLYALEGTLWEFFLRSVSLRM